MKKWTGITMLCAALAFTLTLSAEGLASEGAAGAQLAQYSNPCAAKGANPCAAKGANPCAGKAANPCAGHPCAAKGKAANPCAGNPCAAKEANPCAGKK